MKESSVQIHVDELKVGMKIKIPAKWIEHPFWKNKITIKTPTEIQIIRKLNIKHVDLLNSSILGQDANLLIDSNEDVSINDCPVGCQTTLKDDPDIIQQESVNLRIEESRTTFGKFTDRLDEITNLIIMGNLSAKLKFLALASDLVDFAQSNEKRELISVSSVGSYYPSTQYSISSASFSIIIAKALGSSISDQKKICQTALLLGMERPTHSNDTEINSESFKSKIRKFIDDFDSREIILDPFLTEAANPEVNNSFCYLIKLAMDLIDFFNSNNSKSAKILLGIFFKNNNSTVEVERRVLSLLVKSLGIYPPGTYIRLKKHYFAKVVMSSPAIDNPYVIKCSSVNSDLELIQLADIRTEILELLSCKDVPLSVSKKLNVSMQNFLFI